MTPDIIHDSQMLAILLDPENRDDFAWAGSAYLEDCFEALLRLGGFENYVHKKGAQNHLPRDAPNDRHHIKSAIRA